MRKTPLIIGLVLHIIYYIFALLSLCNYKFVHGLGTGFKLWIYAIVLALVCLFVHLIQSADELLSYKSKFGITKLLLVIIGFLLYFFIGIKSGIWNSIIWNCYFTTIFVFQIFSLFIRKYDNK